MTQKKEIFRLTMDASKEQLRAIRKEQQFYCPACNGVMILKVGDVYLPHFAHRKKNESCQLFSDKESAQHIKGKHLLFNWLKQQKIPVLMEPYLPVINQRPDLLLMQQNSYTALEFQCSTISSSLIRKRTKGYLGVDLQVQWIPLATDTLYQGLQTVNVSEFQKQFIENQQLIQLHTEEKAFHLFEYILPLYGKKHLFMNEKIPMNLMTYPFEVKFRALDQQMLFEKWMKERKRYLMNRLRFNKMGVKNPLLKVCYEQKIALLDLPNWIGLPGRMQLREHPVEWQLFSVLLLYEVDEGAVYGEFCKRYPSIQLNEGELNRYLYFVKNKNPQLLWKDLADNSIFEEIFSQYVALKFDN